MKPFAFLAAFALGLTASPSLAAGPTEWPMFRIGPGHAGAAGTDGLTASPKLRWRFDTGGIVELHPP